MKEEMMNDSFYYLYNLFLSITIQLHSFDGRVAHEEQMEALNGHGTAQTSLDRRRVVHNTFARGKQTL